MTRDELESKGYVKDLSEYAKKSELYNDSDLRNRVVALETKEDKDTKYDDTEVKRRLTELENKPAVDTSVFVTEEKLSEKGYLTQHQDLTPYALKSEIPQPYNDTPLKERVIALENRPATGGSVDISNLATKEELAKAVTKEELETKHYVTEEELNNKAYLTQQNLDNYALKSELPNVDLSNYVTSEQLENKHYLTQHQELSHLATTSDLEALRNIAVSKAELSKKLDTTEYNSFKDSVVTKTELAEKGYLTTHQDISNLATKQEVEDTYVKKSDLPTPYNDSALVQKIGQLEARVDNDTVYDDTSLKERLTALESRPTNQSEMRGTGMPNGVVEAPIGTTYIDTAKTNGALKWIKTTDGGTTGWKVAEGDTGWVLGWQNDKGNRMYFRRKNDVVHVKFEPKISDSWFNHECNLILDMDGSDISHNLSIQGFQPLDNIVQTIFKRPIDIPGYTSGAENSEGSQGVGAVILHYLYNSDNLKTGLDLLIATSSLSGDENHVNPFSYLTEDEWPVQLP